MGRKAQLERYWEERAKELARSGEHISLVDIERRLTAEGCAFAAKLLDPSFFREDLYELMSWAERQSKGARQE